jgi:hypothetical protein
MTMSRRWFRYLFALLACAANARAEVIFSTGSSGAAGGSGNSNNFPTQGQNGFVGGVAEAILDGVGAGFHQAQATGGQGGTGGIGGSRNGLIQGMGADGGRGGGGGDAYARIRTITVPSGVTLQVGATGGAGGAGGSGGTGLLVSGGAGLSNPGDSGSGGTGGDARSVAEATTTGDNAPISILIEAQGGLGGSTQTSLNQFGASGGGDGGNASGSATANALGRSSVDVRALLRGGSGGSTSGGGRGVGGDGANVTAINSIDGTSAGGSVTLSQNVYGGQGGFGGSRGGVGGDVTSILSVEKSTSSLSVISIAWAGVGGSGEVEGGRAGNAIAQASAVNRSGGASVNVQANGSYGGSAYSFPSSAEGNGVSASGSSIASGSGQSWALVSANGNNGGSTFRDSTGTAGPGGTARVDRAYAQSDTGDVWAKATVTGGWGGSSERGNGNRGADAVATNVVDGSTRGLLKLEQTANGGRGGRGVVGGAGGNASSTLSLANSTASRVELLVGASGGRGEFGSTRALDGAGGDADASADLQYTGTGVASANIYAYGDYGSTGGDGKAQLNINSSGRGGAYGQVTAWGGSGITPGDAIAEANIVSNGSASANVSARGGSSSHHYNGIWYDLSFTSPAGEAVAIARAKGEGGDISTESTGGEAWVAMNAGSAHSSSVLENTKNNASSSVLSKAETSGYSGNELSLTAWASSNGNGVAKYQADSFIQMGVASHMANRSASNDLGTYTSIVGLPSQELIDSLVGDITVPLPFTNLQHNVLAAGYFSTEHTSASGFETNRVSMDVSFATAPFATGSRFLLGLTNPVITGGGFFDITVNIQSYGATRFFENKTFQSTNAFLTYWDDRVFDLGPIGGGRLNSVSVSITARTTTPGSSLSAVAFVAVPEASTIFLCTIVFVSLSLRWASLRIPHLKR